MPKFQTSVNTLFHAESREADIAFVFKVTKIDDTEILGIQELTKPVLHQF